MQFHEIFAFNKYWLIFYILLLDKLAEKCVEALENQGFAKNQIKTETEADPNAEGSQQ